MRELSASLRDILEKMLSDFNDKDDEFQLKLMRLLSVVNNQDLFYKLWELWEQTENPIVLIPLVVWRDSEAMRLLFNLNPKVPMISEEELHYIPDQLRERALLINLMVNSNMYEAVIDELKTLLRSSNHLTPHLEAKLWNILGSVHLELRNFKLATSAFKRAMLSARGDRWLMELARYNLQLTKALDTAIFEASRLLALMLFTTVRTSKLLETTNLEAILNKLRAHLKRLSEKGTIPDTSMLELHSQVAFLGLLLHIAIAPPFNINRYFELLRSGEEDITELVDTLMRGNLKPNSAPSKAMRTFTLVIESTYDSLLKLLSEVEDLSLEEDLMRDILLPMNPNVAKRYFTAGFMLSKALYIKTVFSLKDISLN